MTERAPAFAGEILHSGNNLTQMPENGLDSLRMIRQPLENVDVERLAALIESDSGMVARHLSSAIFANQGAVNGIYSLTRR